VYVPLTESEDAIPTIVARRLRVAPAAIRAWSITRRAIDAQKKEVRFCYQIEVALDESTHREKARLRRLHGERVDWHKIDWANADINAYEFVQPPGPRSVLGHVKFSFPSQHTIYMHDTPDKYMFNSAVRTLSHGCLRVRNPMALAEMILAEDKGWDAGKIAELNKSGPLNNEVPLDKRIPIHVAYYTAWVDGDGGLKNFPDIYGHEKRVTQALNGQWDKIDHGKDDQAPVEANFDPRALAARAKGGDVTTADNAADPFGGSGKRGRAGKGQKGGLGDLLSALFGG